MFPYFSNHLQLSLDGNLLLPFCKPRRQKQQQQNPAVSLIFGILIKHLFVRIFNNYQLYSELLLEMMLHLRSFSSQDHFAC